MNEHEWEMNEHEWEMNEHEWEMNEHEWEMNEHEWEINAHEWEMNIWRVGVLGILSMQLADQTNTTNYNYHCNSIRGDYGFPTYFIGPHIYIHTYVYIHESEDLF